MSQVILLAEDDKMIQRLLSRMIKRAGFQGEVAIHADSTSALDFLEQTQDTVVLALMDTALHPEGDKAFALAIQARVPDIKLVASSGHSEADLRGPNHFGDVGLAAVLSKPFGMQDVKDLLSSLGLA